MGLESASHIDELVNTNPVGATDPKSAGDDHLRMIKVVLQNDFPDVDQATSSIIASLTAPPLARKATVWFDETANLLKIRNEADDAWITLPVSITASNTVDINAGAIDGTPIGAGTPSTGAFTTTTTTNLIAGTNTYPTDQGSADQVLSTNGSGTLSWAHQIPPGSVAAWFQASAPTGWTQVVTENDKAVRIVSGTGGGTGGTVAFETAFASQSVTGTNSAESLSIAQMPIHSHNITGLTTGIGGDIAFNVTSGAANKATDTAGSGDTHNHTFTGDAIDMDVSYINMLLASKD